MLPPARGHWTNTLPQLVIFLEIFNLMDAMFLWLSNLMKDKPQNQTKNKDFTKVPKKLTTNFTMSMYRIGFLYRAARLWKNSQRQMVHNIQIQTDCMV